MWWVGMIYQLQQYNVLTMYPQQYYNVLITLCSPRWCILDYILYISWLCRPAGVPPPYAYHIPCAVSSIDACIYEEKVGGDLQLVHVSPHRLVYTYIVDYD